MKSVLQLLMQISEKGHIPLLVIGGYALQAYGVTRQTLDVDVLISEAHTTAMDAALLHLVAMKLHAIRTSPQREPRDFADIVELVRSNPGSISQDELHSLCTTYAPEGI